MRRELLGKIGRNTFIYGLGSVLQRVLSIFVIPLYIHYLTPKDYGTIEMLDLTGYILAMFIGVGIGSAVVRFYYEYNEKKEQNEVISTAVIFLLIGMAGLTLLLHFISGSISHVVFGQEGYRYFINVVLLSLAFNIVCGVLMSYIRAKQQAVFYTAISVLQLIIGLSLNIWFITQLQMGVLGVLYSGLITQMLIAVFLLIRTVYEVGFHFSFPKLKEMLRFGVPLIPAGVSIFVLNFADRFFLMRYADLSVVGTYALGYKIGMSLNALLFAPFYLYWSAYLYEVAQKPNAKELFAHIFEYISLGLIFGALALSLFSHDLIRVFAPSTYWSASGIVPIIAFSYVLNGIYYYFQLGVVLTKRTWYRAYAVGISAVLNIALNFLLIPKLKGYGAAWATLISFFALAVLSYFFSQRLYPVAYSFTNFAKVTLTASAVFACSLLVQIPSLVESVAFHMTLLACFPLALLAMNLYRKEQEAVFREAASWLSKHRTFLVRG